MYNDALEELWKVNALNEKGLNDYIVILRKENTDLRLKMLGTENQESLNRLKSAGKGEELT